MRLRRSGHEPTDDLARDVETKFPLDFVEVGKTLRDLLAAPRLVTVFGGTQLGGTTAGSRLCNMDSTPKAAGTLANQNVTTFWTGHGDLIAPSGFKTQLRVHVAWQRNNTDPNVDWVWGPWEIQSVAGGAGGYTETVAGTFATNLRANQDGTPNLPQSHGSAESPWVDMIGELDADSTYGFGVNSGAGTMAANSALRFHGRLLARWVPIA